MLLWAAGFLWNVALVVVLFSRHRARSVPWFTGWIAFGCLYTIALFFIYRAGSRQLYADTYWAGAFIDLLLQIATVLEIAGKTFSRRGRWVEGARRRFVAISIAAPVVGLSLALIMTPAATTRLDALEARASLFTTALICLLFSAVMTVSQQLGLNWRSRVVRESYGLVLWSLVSFVTDSLHSYWRTMGQFNTLEYIRIVVFQAVTLYWCVIFWLPDEESATMPVDVGVDLDRLQGRLASNRPRASVGKGNRWT